MRGVLDRCEVRVVAAGCSEIGRAAEAAAILGRAEGSGRSADRPLPVVFDDLRAALHRAEVDLVVLAEPGDFAAGGHDPDDVAAISAARHRGAKVVTLEPMPASLLQRVQETADEVAADAAESDAGRESVSLLEDAGVSLGPAGAVSASARAIHTTGQAAGLEAGGGWARFLPLFRLAGSMRAAGDLLDAADATESQAVGRARAGRSGSGGGAGDVLALSIEIVGDPAFGSLGARLFDAADLAVHLLGLPESVDAGYVWHDRPRSVYPSPGDTLRGFDGDLTGHLRFADGRSAGVFVSNRAGAGMWRRRLTAVCERGTLCVGDDGLEWFDVSPEAPTSVGQASPTDGSEAVAKGWERAVADQLTRLLDPHVPPPQPTDYARVLAVTGAMLLSARTGEGESPATLLRMAGRS